MNEKRKVQLVGGSFLEYCNSASLREDNKDVHPTHFEWINSVQVKQGSINKGPIFYCDGGLKNCTGVTEAKQIGWLVEPRHLHPENYEYAEKHQDKFDVILTYDKELLDACENARFYPLGGSSISLERWGIYPKSKDVCMFLSNKKTTDGHKLRHLIAERFKGKIDLYGKGVGKTVKSKFEVLKDYRYCIVVESGDIDFYTSEKPIDVISVDCVPIYNGSPITWDLIFNKRGFCAFYNLEELEKLLDSIEESKNRNHVLYNSCDLQRAQNRKIAREFRITEDWIYENYGDLFHD